MMNDDMIGYFLVCGLFGVLSCQIYIYHNSFLTSDKFLIKCIVYGLYLLVVAQTILNVYDAVWTFGSDFGPAFTHITVPILTGIIALIVQVFYARRIYILTGSGAYLLPAIVVALSIFQFVASIEDLLQLSTLKFFKIVQAIWIIPSGLCDIVIAVCMWQQVYKRRKDSIMRRTQAILLQVVKLVIGTGLMTATVAVLSGIFFVGFPHGLLYGIFALSLGPLYATSMLVVLNNRLRHTDLVANTFENVTSHFPQDSSSAYFRSWCPETAGSKQPAHEVGNKRESYRMSDISTGKRVDEGILQAQSL
ncbi:hypothetical protein BDQ17DRAFT_1350096 [Cyathus striatus]|nr:hypothetical protein BDQ17DRAFT_1350096 [Cyathus striatus]